MMKVIYFFVLILLSCKISYTQIQLVIDRRAIKQVGLNGASAIAKETVVKTNMEKVHNAQKAINKYISITQVNMDRIQKAQQDISAFKEGTTNIKVLSRYFTYCFRELQGLASDLPKYPFGVLAYNRHIRSITEHIISIGASISESVTDGEVNLPGSKSKVSNLIDPVKRLEIINRCIFELQRVYSLVREIRLNLLMRNTLRDASSSIFPTASLSADMLSQIQKDVVNLWYE